LLTTPGKNDYTAFPTINIINAWFKEAPTSFTYVILKYLLVSSSSMPAARMHAAAPDRCDNRATAPDSDQHHQRSFSHESSMIRILCRATRQMSPAKGPYGAVAFPRWLVELLVA
jgi:hypothetical protein